MTWRDVRACPYLKTISKSFSEQLSNATDYWEAEASGNGPVAVPEDSIPPVWPCDGFCTMDGIVLVVFLVGRGSHSSTFQLNLRRI
jgi:hypothetical protein